MCSILTSECAVSPLTLAGAQVACPCPEYPGGKMLKDVGTELQHTHRQLRRAAICFREAAARDPGDGHAWGLLAGTLLTPHSPSLPY